MGRIPVEKILESKNTEVTDDTKDTKVNVVKKPTINTEESDDRIQNYSEKYKFINVNKKYRKKKAKKPKIGKSPENDKDSIKDDDDKENKTTGIKDYKYIYINLNKINDGKDINLKIKKNKSKNIAEKDFALNICQNATVEKC